MRLTLGFQLKLRQPICFKETQKIAELTTFDFLQRTGVLGDHMDHVVKVVAMEQKLEQGLVTELVRAPGHLVSLIPVTMVHAVR